MIKCTLENGHQVLFRHVTVAVIILNEQKQVLLIKRSKNVTNPYKYTVPGGFLDRDENVEQGALRELREETGFNGKIKMLFEIIDSPHRPKEDRQNVEFRFIAEVIGGKPTLNKEVTEIKWVSQTDLPPDEQFAFDHLSTIKRYYDYLETPFSVPFFTSK